jgi:hypothetical protein
MFDFTQKKFLMDEGIKAAKQAIPKIRDLIARYKSGTPLKNIQARVF